MATESIYDKVGRFVLMPAEDFEAVAGKLADLGYRWDLGNESDAEGYCCDTLYSDGVPVERVHHRVLSAKFVKENLGSPSPVTDAAPIRVAIKFGSYNERRYGKPWIARVTSWPVGGRPEIDFGAYVGGSGGGEAEIQARPGDIIRWGQKDHRGSRSEARYGVAREDGSVEEIGATEARRLFTLTRKGD